MLRDEGKKLVNLYGGAVPDDLAASYVERFSEPGVFLSVLKYYQAMDGSDRTPSTPITVPTSFIWGSEDIAFERDCISALSIRRRALFALSFSNVRLTGSPNHTRTTSLPRWSARHGSTRRISSVRFGCLPYWPVQPGLNLHCQCSYGVMLKGAGERRRRREGSLSPIEQN